MVKPFNPSPAGTIAVAHATSATTPTPLPDGCDTLAIFNSSDTATAFMRIANLPSESASGANAAIPVAGGAKGDIPIPPLMQIRLSCAAGPKKFSLISSAEDGDNPVYITPGTGN